MTKEEAVKWLKTTMDNYDFFPETKEVLKLAVEALSAECPQNDTDIGTTEPKSSICTRCENKDFCKETLRIYGLPNMRVEECKEYREKPIPTSLLNSEPTVIACDKIDELDMLERMYEPSEVDLIDRNELLRVVQDPCNADDEWSTEEVVAIIEIMPSVDIVNREEAKGYSTMSEEYDLATESLPAEPSECDTCKHNDKEWDSAECDGCCGNNSNYEPSEVEVEYDLEYLPKKDGIQQAKATITSGYIHKADDECPSYKTTSAQTEPITETVKTFAGDEWVRVVPPTEPTNTLKDTETKEHDDLISRAEAIKAVEQEYRIDRGYMVDDYTYGFNQAIDYISDIVIAEAPSVSAERQPEPSAELVTLPGSWLDDEDGTVICSECESEFYYGDDDELGDLFKQQRFCPECGHRMTDDDRWRISKKSILKRIIEQFEDHEQQAKDKPHGLKEYAVWKQAAREVEEYMKARGYER